MTGARTTAAPTGRKKPAQGKERSAAALGRASSNTSSPEATATESSELPKDWSWKSLAEVAADGVPILYGILQPGPDTPGGVPYVRPTEIVEDVIDLSSIRRTTPAIAGKYKRSVLKPDDVILSIVGTIGKVAVVPADIDGGNITQSSVRIRPRSEIVSPRYVAWVLRSPVLRRQFDRHRLGTAVPRLNVAHVRALRVPVPPLPEQRRIVAEIEKQFTRLEAGVAALRRVQANLKRYRAAVQKAACEGRLVPTEAELRKSEGRGQKSKAKFETGAELLARILTERRHNWQGRGQYKEPATPVTAHLPPFPAGWAVASLEQLTSAARPICYGILMPKEDVATGVLFVKVKDMKGDTIDLEGLHRTTPEIAAKYARASLKTGDLLLSIRGTYGRVAEVPKELNGGNITQDTARLDVTSLVNHRYVATCLRNPDCQNHFKRVARGVAVKGVNIGDVRPTPVPLPPLAEQTRIVAEVERRLSVVEELESVVSANLQRATRLRQSILQKAFSGRLVSSEASG